ncbi:MAG: deoxyguanosinetriphosphate triphosphohydrolase [Dehalococcoidia bacterium]|nr:deoxyguanosinetriphosphate triphosphohydrolase [Dehalococcoidia bacterium]
MIENLDVRQRSEAREKSLSPYAMRSSSTHGREREEEQDSVRTAFQRDRDRILHTNAFRRLKHKTQVFIAPPGDHYTTRLTHTLEVSQISRTIARALNLNEDLAEAISLGHDLGHTPFGHIGEDILNDLYPNGFHHNEQSLRVVEKLEKNGQGLNLTWEVRDGILHHSKSEKSMFGSEWESSSTYEAEVVKISDAIAYINHDINDALRANILTEDDLPAGISATLGHSHSQRINTMVCDIIKTSWAVTGYIETQSKPVICMSKNIGTATEQLRQFMFQNVYNIQSQNIDAQHARKVVQGLYEYLTQHEESLPMAYRINLDETKRRVVDFIAGMTDQYALNLADELGI